MPDEHLSAVTVRATRPDVIDDRPADVFQQRQPHPAAVCRSPDTRPAIGAETMAVPVAVTPKFNVALEHMGELLVGVLTTGAVQVTVPTHTQAAFQVSFEVLAFPSSQALPMVALPPGTPRQSTSEPAQMQSDP